MFFNLLYVFAIGLVSPLIAYRMIRFGRYRRGLTEKLFGLSQPKALRLIGNAEHTIWLHAVSVGEVNLLPELHRRLAKRFPKSAVVISASTDTGYDLAIKHFGESKVFFCPLDFTFAVRRTLNHLQCDLLVLAELELWPNLIRTACERRCQVHVVNGRLSDSSAQRYQQFGWLTRSIFRGLHQVSCQNEDSTNRFIACGTPKDRVETTGSLKFDNAPLSRDSAEVTELVNWSGAEPWHRVWCFGSTQAGEEAMALRIYRRIMNQQPDCRLILVPRHTERFDSVAELIESNGFRLIQRSKNDCQYHDSWDADEVLLVDTIGELREWWGVCQIATVGGSFGDRGGQNMIEPAGYGCAVSFGPNTKNFQKIADMLVNAGGAVRVQNENELERFVNHCLDDRASAESFGRSAASLVEQHRGAYDRTLKRLVKTMQTSIQSDRQEKRVRAA